MKLSEPKSLAINSSRLCLSLEEFIRRKFLESKKEGIIVTVSGGLDSSVTAALCARAVGKNKVVGLMLPERCGNPEANRLGETIIAHLGIRRRKTSISPLIRSLGISSLVVTIFGGRKFWQKLIEKINRRRGETVESGYLRMLRGEFTGSFRKYSAKLNGRQRVRLLYAYRCAEEENLLVVGSANRTEHAVGLFAKYGIDDCADLMPLNNLYRSQILQLGAFLGLPEEILMRSPNPDFVPGVTDKYESYLGIQAGKVDEILAGLGKRLSAQKIAKQVDLPLEKVQQIQEIVALVAQQRLHSESPDIR